MGSKLTTIKAGKRNYFNGLDNDRSLPVTANATNILQFFFFW